MSECVHDIDIDTSMTRLRCVKCGKDANVIEIEKIKKENSFLRECVESAIKIIDESFYDVIDLDNFNDWKVVAVECLAKLEER